MKANKLHQKQETKSSNKPVDTADKLRGSVDLPIQARGVDLKSFL